MRGKGRGRGEKGGDVRKRGGRQNDHGKGRGGRRWSIEMRRLVVHSRGGEVGGGNMAEGERWEEEIWQRGRGGRRKYGRGGEVGGGNKNETVIS